MNKELYKLSYSMKKGLERRVAAVIFSIIAVFAVINLILAFLLFPVRQRSVSMQPDISKDSFIMFSPLDKNLSRGSVVMLKPRSDEKVSLSAGILDLLTGFFTARQFLPSKRYGLMGHEEQIRRIIGLPGDTVYMRDYVMYIKPAGEKYFLTEFELVDKPYNVNIVAAPAGWDSSIGVHGSFDSMELGKDQYFVLGDNRSSCVDSRLWGPVSSSCVRAKALAVYFPLNKFRLF